MKRLVLLFVIVFSLSTSCDDILDVEASNTLSGDIYDSDENFTDLLNGAYVNLGGIFDGADGGELFGGDFQLMGTLLSRRINTLFFWRSSEAPDYQDFMDKDILDINLRVENNWRRAYETINTVNGIIANADRISTTSERDRITAESYAIRGILYFEMVRFWGPQYQSSTLSSSAVPIVTDPVTDVNELTTPQTATVFEVYDQAISDLERALIAFQDVSFDVSRINEQVCNAYLARLFMQQNDFDRAIGYLNEVINNGGYSLNNSAMGGFNNINRTNEDVFIIQQNKVSNTGNVGSRTGLVAHLASLSGVGFAALNINYDILSGSAENSPQYGTNDARYILQDDLENLSTIDDINSNTAYYNDIVNTSTVSTAKFYRSDAVIPVIRLAEMKLSRAEALLRTQGVAAAKQDLDDVRIRSNLEALPDDLTEFQFFDSLVIERNRELLFEGIYFHDLKRWSADGRRYNNDSDDFTISFRDPTDESLILPIPQAECDASPGLCN